MPFAPHEIENKKFVVALRGYAKEEVDMFLRAVAADYRALAEEAGKQPTIPEEWSERIENIVRSAWDSAQETTRQLEHDAEEQNVEAAVLVAQREPESEPAPSAEPAAFDSPAFAAWKLFELEKLVREHGDAFPEHVDEFAFTLYYLREHADVEGRLPKSFEVVIEEVFGPLFDRC
jgi:DivIVA domain-containing protein